MPTHPVQFEPTFSDHAVSTIDWIARLASDTPNGDDLSIATAMANAACALYGPEFTIEPSSPSEKHVWRVFGGMMGPVQ